MTTPSPTQPPSPFLPHPSDSPVSHEFMLSDLARSGLVPEDLSAYPVAPVAFGTAGGYCIPYSHSPHMYRVRYNRDENKYIGPEQEVDIWLPLGLTPEDYIKETTLWIIEGEKKAAKFYKHFHLPTIGIGGCWMFQQQGVFLPSMLTVLGQGKRVKVIFDADIYTKPGVQQAAQRLSKMLDQLRVHLDLYTVPRRTAKLATDGVTQIAPIKGLDDLLVVDPSATIHDLEIVVPEELPKRLNELYARLGCLMTEKGQPLPIENNAVRLIPELCGHSLRNDEYTGLTYKDTEYHLSQPDVIAMKVLCLLQEYANTRFKKNHIVGALDLLEHGIERFNPVTEWLKQLKWDGTHRLNTWAPTYLIADDMAPDYVAEWGRLLISGIVARTLRPGCQQDYAFILAGPQGIGKTTFFRELAHIEDRDYYVEYTPGRNLASEGEQRGQGAVFRRNIIVDFSEGVLLRKYSSEEVKSLITRREDQFRKMYSLSMEVLPRHAICVGTTNQNDLLHDPSGSRRFVILAVTAIQRLPQFEKEQLFAEAYARRAEIFAPTWHEIHATMPVIEGAHAETAQTGYNERFHMHDEFQTLLIEYLQSEHPMVTFEGNPVYCRRQIYDAVLSRMSSPATANTANFILKAMQSIRFPYTIEERRRGFGRLKFPNSQLEALFKDVMNRGDRTVKVISFIPK